VFHIVGSDIGKATIERSHGGASIAQLSIFVALLTANCVRLLYKMEGISVFQWQQCLRNNATILHYMHIAYPLMSLSEPISRTCSEKLKVAQLLKVLCYM